MGGAITGSVAIFALWLVLQSTISSFLQMNTAVQASQVQQQDRQTEQRQSQLLIESATFSAEGLSLNVMVKNTGNSSIDHMGNMDLLVEYTDTSGTKVHKYLRRDTASLSPDGWRVDSVLPDTLRPGFWDRGEVLTATVLLSEPADPNITGWMLLVAPNGSTASVYTTGP